MSCRGGKCVSTVKEKVCKYSERERVGKCDLLLCVCVCVYVCVCVPLYFSRGGMGIGLGTGEFP